MVSNNFSKKMSEFNVMQLEAENEEPQFQLGGSCSLKDVKNLGSSSVSKMILQAKVVSDLASMNRRKQDGGKDSESESSEADDPYVLDEFNAGAKNQDSNKKIFRKNYGVEKNIPGFYIIDAKLFPADINYLLRIVKYTIPDDTEFKVRSYQTGKPYVIH